MIWVQLVVGVLLLWGVAQYVIHRVCQHWDSWFGLIEKQQSALKAELKRQSNTTRELVLKMGRAVAGRVQREQMSLIDEIRRDLSSGGLVGGSGGVTLHKPKPAKGTWVTTDPHTGEKLEGSGPFKEPKEGQGHG